MTDAERIAKLETEIDACSTGISIIGSMVVCRETALSLSPTNLLRFSR
jgi:hypothetical protein